MTAPTARHYRVNAGHGRVVWTNDAGTLRRLEHGAAIKPGDLHPDTIRTGTAEGWLEPVPAKGAEKPTVDPLDIDEPEERQDPEAEERATTAEPAAPKNKSRPGAPKTKRRK